jgi:histidinol-phosphate aminotransferase
MSHKTKLIYVCNPNNPTGNITPDRKLRSFCEDASKKALVFVDEAYHEYVRDRRYKSLVDMVKAGKNVLVSRTASKIHGLAGMRIGFGMAKPEIVSALEPNMTAMSLNNIVGLRAALASYQDIDHQAFCLRKNNEARKVVTDLLDEMGRRYAPSETNFIFFHTGKPIKEFQAEMEKRGVRVGRPFPPYLDWCRLSLVKPEQMSLFVRAFREVMA